MKTGALEDSPAAVCGWGSGEPLGTWAASVVWLEVTPTPYNSFLFDAVSENWPGSFKVMFSTPGIADGRWREPEPLPNWWGGYYGGGGLNLKAVREVIGSGSDLVVVAGWNDWTRRACLVGMSLFGRRYAVWTDTPDCTASAKHKIRNTLARLLTARAVAVMGTGRAAVDALRSMGIPAAKIVNFPYWVPLPADVRAGRKAGDVVRFCCVGRLIPYKNFGCAIRALALLDDKSAALDILGSGPELRALQELASGLGVGARVRFLGFADHKEVERYFREEGDCLIHPATGLEPFGVVVAEAMAHALPVIASTRCGAAVDRISDGESGFLLEAPINVDLLAERMSRFVRDPGKIASMGAAARRAAEQWPVERGIQILAELSSGADAEGAARWAGARARCDSSSKRWA